MSSLHSFRGSYLALLVAISILTILIVSFLTKLYNVRRFFYRLRQEGCSMPPHHPIFGHIFLAGKIFTTLPKDAHGHYLANEIRLRFPHLNSMFYLDTWPFSPPVLVVLSPTGMRQMTQENPLLPKHNGQRQFLRPLSGKHDLVTMEGQLWKTWRTIFNPGFSANHLMTLVPTILEDVSIFYGILRGHAEKGDLFSLEEATLSVTLDVIGRVTLNSQFNVQTTYNDMTSALRNQILWCTFGLEPNPLTHINPIRPIMQWYNTRRMNRYINRELENSYAANRGESADKSIVGLALKSYLDESPGTKRDQGMDATFKEFARSQIKVFLFAGHDTTASTICYIYHLLSLNPAALEQVRAEHDTVFGKDLAPVISLITSKPHLLNQLPYTLAVIKESLRLFPVVTIPRAGKSGLFLTDSDGCKYPTKDCLVWGNHHALHRNPLWWPQPNDFIPERWLVAEDDPLHPVKNAWRPFEWGPRNCIGQELALLEMKMIAVLTLREFNVTGVYEEWDQLHGTTGANKTVDGERAYQIQLGSAHPSDGLPCRVKFA